MLIVSAKEFEDWASHGHSLSHVGSASGYHGDTLEECPEWLHDVLTSGLADWPLVRNVGDDTGSLGEADEADVQGGGP